MKGAIICREECLFHTEKQLELEGIFLSSQRKMFTCGMIHGFKKLSEKNWYKE